MTYKQSRGYDNAQKMVFEDTDGKYDIPKIYPLEEDFEMCDFIPFNYALSEKHPENKGVHFYLDDYQFTRLWNNPDRYMSLLGKFKYVLSPDYSLFTDFPMAMNMFNHYKKHWLGAYMQEHGIKVIPTICWSDRSSYDWCFDGEPKNSIVSVSSVGVCQSKETIRLFMEGYEEMIRRLNPSKILFFGKPIINNYEQCPQNVIFMEDFMRARLIDLSKRGNTYVKT